MVHAIYKYSDAVEYLRSVFQEKRRRNPRFSLRSWSRSLGVSNVATMSRVFLGRRPLGAVLAKRIAERLDLGPEEREYFYFLAVAKANAVDVPLVISVAEKTGHVFEHMTPDQFRFIADWHHLAILEMIGLSGFRGDPEWISKRLGGKVSASACSAALSRLNRLGLISVSKSGKRIKRINASLSVHSPDRATALREYYRQSIGHALEAINGQDTDTRFLTTATIAIKKRDFDKAKEIIMKANEKLAALGRDYDSDEVYQLSTQFFQVTKPEGDSK